VDKICFEPIKLKTKNSAIRTPKTLSRFYILKKYVKRSDKSSSKPFAPEKDFQNQVLKKEVF
jgi:hypothetical protein